MSTVDPTSLRSHVPNTTLAARIWTAGAHAADAVRGLAFWATIPLPLVVVATLLTGVVSSAPQLVAGLVCLNVCCAVVGHTHAPDR